jgi:hypothetical protein
MDILPSLAVPTRPSATLCPYTSVARHMQMENGVYLKLEGGICATAPSSSMYVALKWRDGVHTILCLTFQHFEVDRDFYGVTYYDHPLSQLHLFRTMSLAEASEARKARLLALRKRKTGETSNGMCVYLIPKLPDNWLMLFTVCRNEPIVKNRNFDPATRTLRKHDHADDVLTKDTLEKDVEGLAEGIIAEEEERRAQELVRAFFFFKKKSRTGFLTKFLCR